MPSATSADWVSVALILWWEPRVKSITSSASVAPCASANWCRVMNSHCVTMAISFARTITTRPTTTTTTTTIRIITTTTTTTGKIIITIIINTVTIITVITWTAAAVRRSCCWRPKVSTTIRAATAAVAPFHSCPTAASKATVMPSPLPLFHYWLDNQINKQNNSLILTESSSGRHSRANSNDSHSGKTTKTCI